MGIIGATFTSCILAQLAKVIIVFIIHGKADFSRFIGTGGMPSSHASTVVTLTTCIGRSEGMGSPLFAACLIFSLIVMYDAAGIRRAAGQQARILNKIIEGWNHDNPELMNTRLKELLGHTPFQVLVGAIIGAAIGFIAPL